jgi:ABC-type transporter Mla subunit MlaD
MVGLKRFDQRPLFLFFFVACLVATVFFVGWGVYWQGLPEFSQVGIID